MQAMAQMGYQGYQEQMSPALLPKEDREYTNCTPHRPKARFHMIWEDFILIGDNDDANGNALRAFEWLTNQLIGDLRKEHVIPKNCLPNQEDLWLEDVSTRRLAEITLHVREKSTYARCLQDPLDRGGNEEFYGPRSLIELGFVERRFIARPLQDIARPAATFYEDRKGRFILVDNMDGDYTDGDGKLHNAADEGYLVKRQYRYCIEAVNAAIAALDWQDPPKPMKRWPPIVKRRDPVPQQRPGTSTQTDCDPKSVDGAPDYQHNPSQALPQGGTSKAEVCEDESGYIHDTVDTKDMSTIHTDIGMNIPISSAISQAFLGNSKETEACHEAPWSAETLIGLAQARVRPGLFEISGDDADYEAAEKLIEETSALGLSPQASWLLIDRHIAWMADDSSPSWWVTGRAKRTVIALQHVAKAWRDVEIKMAQEAWSPLDTVPYHGPAVVSEYGTGYAEQEVAQDLPEEIVDIPEPAPVRVAGMIPSYAANLLTKIYEEYPSLSAHIEAVAPYKQVVRIEYAPGAWFTIERPSDWNRPSEETRQLIAMAVAASQPAKEGGRSNADDQLVDEKTRDDHRGARSPDNRDGPGLPDDHLQLQDTQ